MDEIEKDLFHLYEEMLGDVQQVAKTISNHKYDIMDVSERYLGWYAKDAY